MLFSTVAVPIYIPFNRAQGFPFLHSLTSARYFLKIDFTYLLIYFWLCWVFFCCAFLGFSLVVMSRGLSLVQGMGFSSQRLLLLQITGLGYTGFSGCSTWAQQLQPRGRRAQTQKLRHMGLVGPQHEGSSPIRDPTLMSPALTGRFFSTEPPGKPNATYLLSS